MTQQEAIFLKEEFESNALGRILKGKVLDIYYEAERILRGWDKKKPRGCTCEYRNMSRIVTSLYEQKKAEIEQLYEQTKMDSGPSSSGPGNL